MDKYFEYKALAEHVKNQLVNNSTDDRVELVDMVFSHFPQFIYAGLAYRYRYNSKREFQPKPYKSYAKTKEGSLIFIENEKFGFKVEEGMSCSLIEADIIGVDLVKLTKHLVYLGFLEEEDVRVFYSEEEVVALEVKNYKIILDSVF